MSTLSIAVCVATASSRGCRRCCCSVQRVRSVNVRQCAKSLSAFCLLLIRSWRSERRSALRPTGFSAPPSGGRSSASPVLLALCWTAAGWQSGQAGPISRTDRLLDDQKANRLPEVAYARSLTSVIAKSGAITAISVIGCCGCIFGRCGNTAEIVVCCS